MSLRRWVSVIAFLAVLAHAAAIPRHNAIMLAGALAAADETAALRSLGIALPAERGLMCRADSSDDGTSQDRQDAPGKSSTCPICLGLASAHAVLPGHGPAVDAPYTVEIERVSVRDQSLAQLRLDRPRARGPPLLA